MIQIFYYRFSEEMNEVDFQGYLNLIPTQLQSETLKYFRWQDRYTNLFGKLLLLMGLREQGFGTDILEHITYNGYGKPSVPGTPSFNLSHSGNTVICAISNNQDIGIDIEKMNPIDIMEFDTIFTPRELGIMRLSDDPILTFYTYWTIKESVIKCIGKGMSLPLNEVMVLESGDCRFRESTFCIQTIPLLSDYYCSLASQKPEEYSVTEVQLSEFKSLRN